MWHFVWLVCFVQRRGAHAGSAAAALSASVPCVAPAFLRFDSGRRKEQREGCCLSAPTEPLRAQAPQPAQYCLVYGLCFPQQSHLTLITSAR